MNPERAKITYDVVDEMRSKFIDTANKYSFDPNQFISVLTSFYTTMICPLLCDDDKKQLMFLYGIKKALSETGFNLITDFTEVTEENTK